MNNIADITGYDETRISAAVQVVNSLEKLIRAHQKLEESRAKKLGLNLAESHYLMFFDADKPQTVKELAQNLGLVKSRITRITDGLVKKALVERCPNPADGRVCLLKLTTKGEEVLYDLKQCCWEAYDRILGDINSQKRMIIMGALNEFTKCLEELPGVRKSEDVIKED